VVFKIKRRGIIRIKQDRIPKWTRDSPSPRLPRRKSRRAIKLPGTRPGQPPEVLEWPTLAKLIKPERSFTAYSVGSQGSTAFRADCELFYMGDHVATPDDPEGLVVAWLVSNYEKKLCVCTATWRTPDLQGMSSIYAATSIFAQLRDECAALFKKAASPACCAAPTHARGVDSGCGKSWRRSEVG